MILVLLGFLGKWYFVFYLFNHQAEVTIVSFKLLLLHNYVTYAMHRGSIEFANENISIAPINPDERDQSEVDYEAGFPPPF
jgi:hypothetical protein